MKLRFLPEATTELREAIAYYADRSSELRMDFIIEFRRTIRQIIENPKAWSKASKRLRRRNLHRFPYGVIYRPNEEEIIVVCVAHLKRRAGYWRGRL